MTHIVTDEVELKELVDVMLDEGAFAFDTETIGADKETGADIRLDTRQNEVVWLSFATRGLSFAVPVGHPHGEQVGVKTEPRVGPSGKTRNFKVPDWSPAPMQLRPSVAFGILEPLFFDEDTEKTGHGLKFDIETIAKYYAGEIIPGPYFDTWGAAFLLNENHHEYKLGKVVAREFGYTYDKSIGVRIERSGFKAAAKYANYDAKFTWLLRQRYAPQLELQGLDGLWALEMDVLHTLLHMEDPLMDVEAAEKLYAELGRERDQLRGQLFRIAGKEVNLNSHPQMAQLLFGKKKDGGFGLKSKQKTAGGQPATSKAALEVHQNHPFVETYSQLQEVDKIHGTYLKAYLGGETEKNTNGHITVEVKPSILVKGRVHTNYKQFGTTTGRFSSSTPNIQNIPRPDTELGKQVRGLFLAAPGHSLIVADYAQIEYVVMAHFSRDPVLVKAFTTGVDLHQLVAGMVFGIPVEDVIKTQRTTAKNTNFACVPMDTTILTRRGWISHDELVVGEDVMSYDGGVMRWTPVLEKMRYEDAPIVRMSSGGWSVRTTPDHRWDTVRRTGRGHTRRFVREWSTTESLNTEHSITTSSWADTSIDGEYPLTVEEVAIIAWVYTDGSIRQKEFVGARAQAGGNRVGFIAQIHQKKYKEDVEELLRGVPHLRSPVRFDGLVTWTLDSVYARDLCSRAGVTRDSLPQFVLGLPPEHRRAFLDACHLAEGHFGRTGQRLYTQNRGPVLEAMRLAILLEGFMPRSFAKKITELTRTPCFEMSESTARVSGQRLVREYAGREDVWCVRTQHGNWVMRQGDVVTLTGNCAYGAGDDKVAAMSKISLDEAVSFRKAHRRMLPKLYRWTEGVVAECRRTRPPHVTTLLGRKRRLPTIHSQNWGMRGEAERQAVNSTIQGSAADIIKLAMVRLNRLCDEELRLTLSVHDELVLSVPDDRIEDGQKVMREAMLGEGIQSMLTVPMNIDMQVVKNWADAKS